MIPLLSHWFDWSPDAQFIADLNGTLLKANQKCCELLQVPTNGLNGRSLMDFFSSSDRGGVKQWLEKQRYQPSSAAIEGMILPSQGSAFEGILNIATIFEPHAIGFMGSLQDISTHRKIERILQQNLIELEAEVHQRTVHALKVHDFESMLKRVTDKVRDSLDENQIMQAVVQELTLVLGISRCNSALYDLDQGTSTIRYEYTNEVPAYQGRVAQMDRYPEIYHQLKRGHYFQFCSLSPNPERGRVAMLACPIFVDPQGAEAPEQDVLGDLWLIHHSDYIFTDMEIRLVQQVANQCAIAIRQARLYQAVQGQVQELEKLNQLKDEFLSTISHELRTPIANVKMAIHMLKTSPSEERRQVYMNILESETAREAELIDELLDLQRLEANHWEVQNETRSLHEWLQHVIEPFQSRFASRQQRFQLKCPANLAFLTTDFAVLQRILAELLNNAYKYTPDEGTISLTVRAQTDRVTDSAKSIIFCLRNQSIIPAEDLPHIFDKFYRVIQPDRYKQGGTGLGLALVLKRVEQLGGTIEVQSRNEWTTFTVRLPAAPTVMTTS